ncbi:MAG: hypothetical protein NC231_09810 [Bacillus sp. (in: Bacteria)]|nr:hypothetical protein [Bacillus sp. (in: firmicutes)]MCM1427036.1 hypothetical protein [Eubacterium sp.]
MNYQRQYSLLPYKRNITALKYAYNYNGVCVNLYFDGYDVDNPCFTMILVHDKNFYYTSLNVKDTNLTKQYLEEIPKNILCQILFENKLDNFFEKVDNYILRNSPITINYNKDTIFVNTMKYNRGRHDLPFLQGTRKVHMQDKTLNNLAETMGIDRDVLLKIQSENITLVRTADVNRRKQLTIVLKSANITM